MAKLYPERDDGRRDRRAPSGTVIATGDHLFNPHHVMGFC